MKMQDQQMHLLAGACWGAGPCQATAPTVTLKAAAACTEAADASRFPPRAAWMCLSST